MSEHPSPQSQQQHQSQQPVLQLKELTRVHGSGATEVHALRGINLDVFPGNSSPSWARPAPASPRSSPSPAASTPPAPGR
ncbi:hypothetical protein ACFQ60_26020 [Streptomyces zhihengii]